MTKLQSFWGFLVLKINGCVKKWQALTGLSLFLLRSTF